MILVTGAAGKTGKAVLKALQKKSADLRVLVRSREQAEGLSKYGILDAVIGDLTSTKTLREALDGVCSVYHICPNMHPEEEEIGRLITTAARDNNVDKFVYHSVLHPQTEKMQHHWQKMRVEEMLFESGLEFTILQPAPYMQNILANREAICNESIFKVPYPVDTKLSLVDLEDLARVAATVLCEPGHKGAIYEIVGTGGLTQLAVAEQLSKVFGRNIAAEEQPLDEWRNAAEKSGMNLYQVKTLIKMFTYYSRYGLVGNSNVLSWLLKDKPNSFYDFAKRDLAE